MTQLHGQPNGSKESDGSGRAAMIVQQLLPARTSVDLAEVLSRVSAAPVAVPFDPVRVSFVAEVSRQLGRKARELPETQALAFWMRKSELHRLANSFGELGSEYLALMPRGTVFHIPPANVDTLFVYSWALSTLCGNSNIVRLSSRMTKQSDIIISTISEVLEGYPEIQGSTAMITYGHNDEFTASISAVSDVRVIWGGDATVNWIRSIPIPAHASEMVFADRFSMAAINTAAYKALSPSARDRLVELFYTDAYWFDQLGCSSARLLLWVGSDEPSTITADFYQRLRSTIESRGYSVEASTAMAKLTQSYGTMIDEEVSGYHGLDNTLTVLQMSSFPDVRGEFCGAGLFYQLQVTDLLEIVPHIRRSDQTLATFGISEEDLQNLVTALRGRGIDRIVPFGQALNFSRYWDGYDLLAELTRKITIDSSDFS